MMKDAPDHLDADLIIKLYDLRREASLRKAREVLASDFWPANAEEAVAVLKRDHPLNREHRQVSTYWEMVYRMARYGIIHGDFLVENNAEGLLNFAKIEPFLPEIRAASHPGVFSNAEWVSTEVPAGRSIAERMRAQVKARLAKK
jgi:hypothetical protein